MEIIKPLCSWSIVLMALVFPLLTLTSFSQEYRQKTFYLWAMSPMTATKIVIGKSMSLLLVLCFILLSLLLMISTLHLSTTLNWSEILLSISSVFLIGASIICFGLFVSSCSANPVLCLGFTYVGELAWMMLPWLNPFPEKYHFLAKDLSLLDHSRHAFMGILYSPDLLFFILVCVFWTSLTIRRVKHKMTSVTP